MATAFLVAGCRETLEIRYETEHLRVGTSFDEPLCGGDLARMEAQIERVEALLGSNLDGPVDVYLWSTEDWPPEGNWCGAKLGNSCYDPARREIYARLPALHHELVHPIIDDFAKPSSFVSEGMAEGLAVSRLIFSATAPSDNLDLEQPALDYGTAGHFSRWLLARYGEERYRALLRSGSDARGALEETYGVGVEELEALYFNEAPYSYGPLGACEHPAIEVLEPGRWSEHIALDCASAETYGGPLGMGSYRLLEIETRDDYAFSTSAPTMTIARCMEDLEDQPWPTDAAWGDLPPTTPVFRQQFWRRVDGEQPAVLDLVPGRYELALAYPDHVPRSAKVTVWRYRGPTPTVPESKP